MNAPRSASKTQAPAAARDGFVTYDELRGRTSTLRAGARRACRSRRAASRSRWTPTRSWPSARARCE
jgi:hypothetical protein